MDTLCFSCPKLARNLMSPASQGKAILEFDFDKILVELELTYDQFIDVCILCGCDYCDSIKGVGPVKALALIKKCGSIEGVLKEIDQAKYPVPEDWPFEAARELFRKPDVVDTAGLELKWSAPDEEGVVAFLCGEKQFSEDRVRNVGLYKVESSFYS
jgi:flap endonuclease-1